MKSKHSNSGRKWQNCRRSRYTMRISIRRWKDFWTNITLSKYVSIPNCSPRYRVGQNLGSISISQARTRIMQLAEVGTKCYVARNSICLDTVIPLFGYGESIRMNLQRIAGICQEGFFPRQSNFYVMVPFLFAKGWVRIFDVCAWSCLNNFSGQKKLI